MDVIIEFGNKEYTALCDFLSEALHYFREEDIRDKDVIITMPKYIEYAFEHFLRGHLYHNFNPQSFHISHERKKLFYGLPVEFNGYENKAIVYWKDWHLNPEIKHKELDLSNCLKTV